MSDTESDESEVEDVDEELERPKHIDDKTAPMLFELFKADDMRKLADARGIRKAIWQRFWDRLFETEEYTAPKSKTGDVAAPTAAGQRDLNVVTLMSRLEPRKKQLEAAPPYLLNYDGSLWERHQENLLIMKAVGREAYEAACAEEDKSAPFYQQLSHLKSVCVERLAGVDVYWDGDVEDKPTARDNAGYYYRRTKPNSSKTKWGVLKIVPFPFVAVFRYDDTEEYAIFSTVPIVHNTRRIPKEALAQLEEFVNQNLRPEILEEREMRLKLRSLDDVEITVEVTQPKHREVRGTFHVKLKGEDADAAATEQKASEEKDNAKKKHKKKKGDKGKEEEAEAETYKPKLDVRQLASFKLEETGDLWENPATKEVLSLAPGFFFEISTKKPLSTSSRCAAFVCGEPDLGVHPDNFTRQTDDVEEGLQILSREALNLRHDYFDIRETVFQKMIHPSNLDLRYIEYLRALYQTYRDSMNDEYTWKKKVLSYEFGLYIYEGDRITRDELENTLIQYEDRESPLIRDLVRGFKGSRIHHLQDLYDRVDRYDSSLMTCCWYMFWHAIEDHNRASGYSLIPMNVQRLLDPSEPGSAFGRELKRPELTILLTENNVYNADGTGVINDVLIDQLYDKLEELKNITVLHLADKIKEIGDHDSTTAPTTPRTGRSSRVASARKLSTKMNAQSEETGGGEAEAAESSDTPFRPNPTTPRREISAPNLKNLERKDNSCARVCAGKSGCIVC